MLVIHRDALNADGAGLRERLRRFLGLREPWPVVDEAVGRQNVNEEKSRAIARVRAQPNATGSSWHAGLCSPRDRPYLAKLRKYYDPEYEVLPKVLQSYGEYVPPKLLRRVSRCVG